MSRIKEISVSELSQLIESKNNFKLIDIRTPVEIKRGVIPGAKTLPMHLVPLNLNYFSTTQERVVIYCRTGSRSAQVCRFLDKQGLTNACSLRGGVVKWASSGLGMDSETPEAIA
ncbi:MAG: rhodanese-related sulfurtransferase [Gammaproteobacteria bacterium]|jgi:rhodanese-related sulfurtransferase